MKKWRAIIVDDEFLARSELISQLKNFPQVEIAGEAADADSAYNLISDQSPDLVFLDIDLGVTSGFELLERVDSGIKVIFVTAHNEFAIRAFEVNALDYLLKPVWPDRLGACISRLGNPYSGKLPEQLDFHDQILVKIRSGSRFVKINEITCIEACSDYTRIYSSGRFSGLVHHTMKRWLDRLPGSGFVRIHKSYIINITHILSLNQGGGQGSARLIYPDREIPVSRRYGSQLYRSFKP